MWCSSCSGSTFMNKALRWLLLVVYISLHSPETGYIWAFWLINYGYICEGVAKRYTKITSIQSAETAPVHSIQNNLSRKKLVSFCDSFFSKASVIVIDNVCNMSKRAAFMVIEWPRKTWRHALVKLLLLSHSWGSDNMRRLRVTVDLTWRPVCRN